MTTPPMPTVLALGTLSFVVSWWLTGRVRRYALHRGLLDHPTARSSHSVITPRGGGAAIVVVTVAALVAAAALGVVAWPLVMALVPAGVAVAAIGWVDDHHGHVPARWRLLVHLLAAVWVLWTVGAPGLQVAGVPLAAGVATLAGVLYVAWTINYTNFMDGIDGITSVEVISVAAGAGVLGLIGIDGTDASAAVLVAAATTGFLVWNRPPARIFLGDVGSGFLGLTMATLAVHAGHGTPALFWSYTILLGTFAVDATVTLARRALRRERVHTAHRSHAYQHAAARLGHGPVTLAVAAINLGWLLPLAVLAGTGRLDGAAAVLIAYAPLVVAAVALGAGVPGRPTGVAIPPVAGAHRIE